MRPRLDTEFVGGETLNSLGGELTVLFHLIKQQLLFLPPQGWSVHLFLFRPLCVKSIS